MERRHADAGDVAERDVGCSLQVRKFKGKSVKVSSKTDNASRVLQFVHVDGLQSRVLCDVEVTNALQGDTVKAGETGIDNGDGVSLRNTLGEGQSLQEGQSLEFDAANAAERAEVEGSKTSKAVQGERLSNGAKLRGSQGSDVLSTLRCDAASDLFNSVQGDVAGSLRHNFNIALKGLAASKYTSIAGALDLEGTSRLASCSQSANWHHCYPEHLVLTVGGCSSSLSQSEMARCQHR